MSEVLSERLNTRGTSQFAGGEAPQRWCASGMAAYMATLGLLKDATWSLDAARTTRWSCTYTGDRIDRGYVFVIDLAASDDFVGTYPSTSHDALVLDGSSADLASAPSDTDQLTPQAVELTGPNAALHDVACWTRLTVDELASLFGASRRSIYNWLDGKPISQETAGRIVQTHALLHPIAESRDPLFVRQWLYDGDPPAANLVLRGDWKAVRTRVEDTLAPVQSVASDPEGRAGEMESGYGDEVLLRVGAALRVLLPQRQSVDPEWTPRELTGLSLEEASEDEDP